MKRSSGQFIFAVSILAFIVLAGTTLSLAASKSATPKADRVEVRIKELHTALNITPEQEELWNNVAQVMRDNAKTMDTLIKARENAKPMNAVEASNPMAKLPRHKQMAPRNSSRSSRLSTTACRTLRRRMLIPYSHIIATTRSQRQKANDRDCHNVRTEGHYENQEF